jgi:hygromycin-B 7''-O-kinase
MSSRVTSSTSPPSSAAERSQSRKPNVSLDRFTGEYASRLGLVTGEQLQAALDCFDLGVLLEVTPVRGGIFGQNVFLKSTAGKFVLRGCPHYDWQLAKERSFARLIHERTSVPAPWPYLIAGSTEIFGWDFAILPRMPGLQLPDANVRGTLTKAEQVGVATALGECLAGLHAISWPFCGDNPVGGVDVDLASDLDGIKPIEGSYREWMTGRVERRVVRCLAIPDAMSEEEATWCRGLLEANADALDIPFVPTLVHHDFKEGNVVVEREATRWRVSGVFDLMECYFGDGEEDLVRSALDYRASGRDEYARAFISAYALNRPLRAGFRQRFIINMLHDCLLIWRYRKANGPAFAPGLSFRVWAEPFVTLDPFP